MVIPNDGCGLYLEPAELSKESLILFVLLVSEIQEIEVSGDLAYFWKSRPITPFCGGPEIFLELRGHSERSEESLILFVFLVLGRYRLSALV